MNDISVAEKLKNHNIHLSLHTLKHKIKEGSLKVLFQFTYNATHLYQSKIIKILNLKQIYYIEDLNSIQPDMIDAVLIMDCYDTADRELAIQYAINNHLPVLVFELGFIYSVSTKLSNGISYIIDTTNNIYTSTDQFNEINRYLNSRIELSTKRFETTKELIKIIQENSLTKYNLLSSEFSVNSDKAKILLVDQILNDTGITRAEANQHSFDEMLDFVLKNYSEYEIYVKVHPETELGIRRGNINLDKCRKHHIKILSKSVSLKSLFSAFDKIFVVSSGLGLEALIFGKEVHCFGKAFYAGWGLTHDHVSFNYRLRKRTLEDLVYAYYIRSAFYFNTRTNSADDCLSSVKEFIKVINSYRASDPYMNYLVQNYNNRLYILERKIGRLTNLINTAAKLWSDSAKRNQDEI